MKGEISRITVGTDKKKIENYKKAIGYVEKTVLQAPDFFEGDSTKIIHAIKGTNKHLCQQLLPNAGKYRTLAVLVMDAKIKDGKAETTEEVLARNGGTAADFKNWNKIIQKIGQYGTFEKAFDHVSKEEIETLKKIGFVACRPEEVPSEMIALADRIQEIGLKIINREVDAVAAAAYVHQEIVKVHPFEDGNGRTARIWMNAMLQLGGFKAVVLPDGDEYSAAVDEDQKSPGTFVSYLEKTIEWNSKQEVLSK